MADENGKYKYQVGQRVSIAGKIGEVVRRYDAYQDGVVYCIRLDGQTTEFQRYEWELAPAPKPAPYVPRIGDKVSWGTKPGCVFEVVSVTGNDVCLRSATGLWVANVANLTLLDRRESGECGIVAGANAERDSLALALQRKSAEVRALQAACREHKAARREAHKQADRRYEQGRAAERVTLGYVEDRKAERAVLVEARIAELEAERDVATARAEAAEKRVAERDATFLEDSKRLNRLHHEKHDLQQRVDVAGPGWWSWRRELPATTPCTWRTGRSLPNWVPR